VLLQMRVPARQVPHGLRAVPAAEGLQEGLGLGSPAEDDQLRPLRAGAVWQAFSDRQPADQKQTYDQWAGAKVKQMCPLGRWQTPNDIAALALFLASDRAANITGQTMNVDGGWVMHW
jgi:NAD(P)-dependent dehydrogenase (short-subunit alcohol dehydrogenase family)